MPFWGTIIAFSTTAVWFYIPTSTVWNFSTSSPVLTTLFYFALITDILIRCEVVVHVSPLHFPKRLRMLRIFSGVHWPLVHICHKELSLCFLLRVLLILIKRFISSYRYVIHFELILVHNVRVQIHYSAMCTSSFPSTFWWRNHSFPSEWSWYPS